MSEVEAEVCAAANSWIYRIGEKDGEGFILTKDYRTNRVTVSIESGFITKELVSVKALINSSYICSKCLEVLGKIRIATMYVMATLNKGNSIAN
jgi:hypothetical protein